MKPGATSGLGVRVTNLAGARWPCAGTRNPIQLGNHWLSRDGKLVTNDDGRAGMPGLVEPGDAGVFNIEVTAPTRPGSYILELDMVEEGVTWFAGQGSQCLRLPVKVSGSLTQRFGLRRPSSSQVAAPPSRPAASGPVMEMHCLPRQDVLAVVAQAGGVAVYTSESEGIGDGHVTCSYVVRRASAQ
jgi:hypothetical protein